MLMGAHTLMLAEARAWINRHTEVPAIMLAEPCAHMLAEARARSFILRLRACTETHANTFLLKIRASTESRPQEIPR